MLQSKLGGPETKQILQPQKRWPPPIPWNPLPACYALQVHHMVIHAYYQVLEHSDHISHRKVCFLSHLSSARESLGFAVSAWTCLQQHTRSSRARPERYPEAVCLPRARWSRMTTGPGRQTPTPPKIHGLRPPGAWLPFTLAQRMPRQGFLSHGDVGLWGKGVSR